MVYVDMLINYGWKLRGKIVPSCHMLADTEEELHEMALKIGMKRGWFQDGETHTMPHYDLVESRRILAIKNGAIEINRNQLIEMLKKYKNSKV